MTLPDFSQSVQFNTLREEMGITLTSAQLQAVHAQMVETVDLMIEGTHFYGSREIAERAYRAGYPVAQFAEAFARFEIQRYDWITALDGTIITRRELA